MCFLVAESTVTGLKTLSGRGKRAFCMGKARFISVTSPVDMFTRFMYESDESEAISIFSSLYLAEIRH